MSFFLTLQKDKGKRTTFYSNITFLSFGVLLNSKGKHEKWIPRIELWLQKVQIIGLWIKTWRKHWVRSFITCTHSSLHNLLHKTIHLSHSCSTAYDWWFPGDGGMNGVCCVLVRLQWMKRTNHTTQHSFQTLQTSSCVVFVPFHFN